MKPGKDSTGPLFPYLWKDKVGQDPSPYSFHGPSVSQIKALITITIALLSSINQVPGPVPSFYVNEIGRQFSPNSPACLHPFNVARQKHTAVRLGSPSFHAWKLCSCPCTLPHFWKPVSHLLPPSTSTTSFLASLSPLTLLPFLREKRSHQKRSSGS